MLRLTLHLVLAAAFTVGPGPKDKAPPGCRNPDGLYEEGRRDLSQKFTKSAIEKFEEAYRCSKNPLILYNIGLAYKRLYDDEKQRERLEKAKEMLTNYVAAIERDPSLGADPEEVRPVLEEIDVELKSLTAQEEPEGPTEPPVVAPPPTDPGKKLRLAGIGLMAGGGALTVAGVVVGGLFAAKGQDLKKELDQFYVGFKAQGCGIPATADSGMADKATCDGLRDEREDLLAKGTKANTLAISLTAVGALGLGILVGGVVAFAKGKQRSERWRSSQARVRVLPSFGGLVLEGRF